MDIGKPRETLSYSLRKAAARHRGPASARGETLPAPDEALGSQTGSLRPPTRFERRAKLGRGGMAVVDLVRDVALARDVAVKTSLGRSDTHLFLREARITARLEHPNIVPVHDIRFEEDGTPELVMKAVEGCSLLEVIDGLRARDPATVRAFGLERRLEIVVAVLRALAFAHAKGVLHRDIKPDNIMIGRFGEVLLLDWGVARAEGEPDVTPEGTLVGTPGYMSPEQARGELLDERSDLFAVAVVLHELLRLHHYVDPDLREPLEIATFVGERGACPSLMEWHRPGVEPMAPMELFHFLRKAMAHDREDRFANTGEMLGALQGILDGYIRVQCHITLVKSTVRRAGRFVDRYPWLSFAAFCAGVGVMGTGVVSIATRLLGG